LYRRRPAKTGEEETKPLIASMPSLGIRWSTYQAFGI
jgi:hypothetical protein